MLISALFRHGTPHWNATVNKMTYQVLSLLRDDDGVAFAAAAETALNADAVFEQGEHEDVGRAAAGGGCGGGAGGGGGGGGEPAQLGAKVGSGATGLPASFTPMRAPWASGAKGGKSNAPCALAPCGRAPWASKGPLPATGGVSASSSIRSNTHGSTAGGADLGVRGAAGAAGLPEGTGALMVGRGAACACGPSDAEGGGSRFQVHTRMPGDLIPRPAQEKVGGGSGGMARAHAGGAGADSGRCGFRIDFGRVDAAAATVEEAEGEEAASSGGDGGGERGEGGGEGGDAGGDAGDAGGGAAGDAGGDAREDGDLDACTSGVASAPRQTLCGCAHPASTTHSASPLSAPASSTTI
eukprot:6200216-Pleurochrysis_carterae.AAC.1